MDLDWTAIRRIAIIAMFSDDVLMEKLVLKGGNALNLVHRLGSRTSLDIDFSLEGDFENLEDARARIFRALGARFGAEGYKVFDERFFLRPKPRDGEQNQIWSGYAVEFKLIESSRNEIISKELDRARREALVVGPAQAKVFTIEISKFEYCLGKAEAELDDYTVYVYTPAMLSIEKLRAICQQMNEYRFRPNKTARARDFYDIHTILETAGVDWGHRENLDLTRNIFAAKEVPLDLIARIPEYREFHRQDWPSVHDSVTRDLRDYDFYFNYVVQKSSLLESLWNE